MRRIDTNSYRPLEIRVKIIELTINNLLELLAEKGIIELEKEEDEENVN